MAIRIKGLNTIILQEIRFFRGNPVSISFFVTILIHSMNDLLSPPKVDSARGVQPLDFPIVSSFQKRIFGQPHKGLSLCWGCHGSGGGDNICCSQKRALKIIFP
jgi:hypothetical protein